MISKPQKDERVLKKSWNPGPLMRERPDSPSGNRTNIAHRPLAVSLAPARPKPSPNENSARPGSKRKRPAWPWLRPSSYGDGDHRRRRWCRDLGAGRVGERHGHGDPQPDGVHGDRHGDLR